MTMWTITGGTGLGGVLVGYRILVTPGAFTLTYQFLPPGTGVGGGFGSLTPHWQLQLNGQYLNINAGDPPPASAYWSGSCYKYGQREAENGTWQAEATGGGPFPLEGDDDSEESEKDKSDEDDAQ